MGRYDFRLLRVHQIATQLLATQRITVTPPWYSVVGRIPPSETLVRTQPIQHQNRYRPRSQRTKKPRKLFQPLNIVYEEDALRKTFFTDHPWELARPRMVLENDGKDAERCDWSKMAQPARTLSGESVVQRQLWLLRHIPNITRTQAYDQARKEFYELRLREDVQRRVAKEEALATGAYFGKSVLTVGMELENREFDRWKAWAEKELTVIKQRQAAAYSGGPADAIDGTEPILDEADASVLPLV